MHFRFQSLNISTQILQAVIFNFVFSSSSGYRDIVLFIHRGHNIFNTGAHGCRSNVVIHIIFLLYYSSSIRLFDGSLHGAGYYISIEYHQTVNISRSPATGLHQ